MKRKFSTGLVLVGILLFLMSGVSFLVDFMSPTITTASGVIALVCVGSGTTIGRPNLK
jgi:hypothetical protein